VLIVPLPFGLPRQRLRKSEALSEKLHHRQHNQPGHKHDRGAENEQHERFLARGPHAYMRAFHAGGYVQAALREVQSNGTNAEALAKEEAHGQIVAGNPLHGKIARQFCF